MVFDVLKDVLLPYKHLIFLVMFAVFFALLATAIKYHRVSRVRRGFMVFFFCCLLLTTLGGQHVLPFTQWHKFSTTAEENVSHYRVQMVTEDGTRVPLDSDIGGFAPSGQIASEFATEYTPQERQMVARDLIQESNEHRDSELNQSAVGPSLLKFPPHGLGGVQ